MMRILAWLLLVAAVLPSVALEVRRAQDAYWVSGGVSADERDEMIMALPDHNLKVLTAAEKSGAFLAGAQVVVRDAGGRTVFETSLDGPWLLARLPPGNYQLIATLGGKSQTRTFTVPAGGRREIFLYWAAPEVETLPRGAVQ
jgi:Carboxypeptidase regulatory-like domain